VDRSGYKAAPWVKYLTKNGEYQLRINWYYRSIVRFKIKFILFVYE
jgi:hypothetical protein